MVDRYTKIVLTVIAISLVALVIQNLSPAARAQISAGCGTSSGKPCWITSAPSEPVYVQSDPRVGLYVSTIPSQPLEVRLSR